MHSPTRQSQSNSSSTGISQSREHTGYTAACIQRCCIIYDLITDLITGEFILYGDLVQVGKLVERGESFKLGVGLRQWASKASEISGSRGLRHTTVFLSV